MIAVVILNSFFVLFAVIVHYEFLYHLTRVIPHLRIRHRYRIVLGVFGTLTAHAVEIWLFAFGYFFLQLLPEWGHLEGRFNGSLLDCSYFSFVTFTTVGFGDINPVGNLRYLAGIEALTGLVLISWTASFLFYEMRSNWDIR
jgi:hypothetical protein